jgi:hypothetical protein
VVDARKAQSRLKPKIEPPGAPVRKTIKLTGPAALGANQTDYFDHGHPRVFKNFQKFFRRRKNVTEK